MKVGDHEQLSAWFADEKYIACDVDINCTKSYLWKCPMITCDKGCQHSFIGTPYEVIKNGCTICSLKQPCIHRSAGFHLSDLVPYFDSEKNSNIIFFHLFKGHKTPLWWKCEKLCSKGVCYHSWYATIAEVRRKWKDNTIGCPHCGISDHQGKVNCFHDSLAGQFPEIAQWYDHEKNSVPAVETHPFTSKKRWWICPSTNCINQCKHKYEAPVQKLTRSGRPCCVFCSKQKVCIHNSVSTTHPEHAKFLMDEKNELKSTAISYGSTRLLWFKCKQSKCGCPHVWQSKMSTVIQTKRCCPYCSNRLVCKHTSLGALFPHLVDQWHPNNIDDPFKVNPSSQKKVKWICKQYNCPFLCAHEWESTIQSRTKIDSAGCPYCSKPAKQVCKHNSVGYLFPDVAKTYHEDNECSIWEVHPGSVKMRKWKCENVTCPKKCEHVFQTTVQSRLRAKNCPFCSNPPKRVCPCNSLAGKFPNLMLEWSQQNSVSPLELAPGSNKPVKWYCRKSSCDKGCVHGEWIVPPNNRTNGKSGCGKCSGNELPCVHLSIAHNFPELLQEFDPTSRPPAAPPRAAPAQRPAAGDRPRRAGAARPAPGADRPRRGAPRPARTAPGPARRRPPRPRRGRGRGSPPPPHRPRGSWRRARRCPRRGRWPG